MMNTLSKANGIHRIRTPEQTHAWIQDKLSLAGITRCARVTGLDYLDIPVYCAIRPTGTLLQVSNGKGFTPMASKVSALMEAIELHHAENPSGPQRRASMNELIADGLFPVSPRALPGGLKERFFSPDFKTTWVPGQELFGEDPVWLSHNAVFYIGSTGFHWSSNGLASGNHLLEATLHALYEIAERDTISRLRVNGRMKFDSCLPIDLDSIRDEVTAGLCDKVRSAGVRLLLLAVVGKVSLPTFWAVLLDDNPVGFSSRVRLGYGCHLSAEVAATRAITEAAQSRLTFIHGAREDLVDSDSYAAGPGENKLFEVFAGMQGTVPWDIFAAQSRCAGDLNADFEQVLAAFADAGYHKIHRADLTREAFGIPVVKVFVPGARFHSGFF